MLKTDLPLHDQFPEEEGLKPSDAVIVSVWSWNLHDQFPEEEGLKLTALEP